MNIITLYHELGAYESALQPKKLVTIDGGDFDPYDALRPQRMGAAVGTRSTRHQTTGRPKPERNMTCLSCTTKGTGQWSPDDGATARTAACSPDHLPADFR